MDIYSFFCCKETKDYTFFTTSDGISAKIKICRPDNWVYWMIRYDLGRNFFECGKYGDVSAKVYDKFNKNIQSSIYCCIYLSIKAFRSINSLISDFRLIYRYNLLAYLPLLHYKTRVFLLIHNYDHLFFGFWNTFLITSSVSSSFYNVVVRYRDIIYM